VRNVILHYHIFKNAGTSIETALSRSFGSAWRSYDKDPLWANVTASDFLEILEAEPELKAISSHQGRWPVPSADGLRIFPLLLLRHPIDRVGSMYSYNRRIGEPDAMARTLSEYVDWLLGDCGSMVVRSFQTLFLSDDDALTDFPGGPVSEVTADHLSSALNRLNGLEVFGLVERFEESIAIFRQWLEPTFPELKLTVFRENASTDRHSSLKERLHKIANQLGRRRMRRLKRVNEADLELWSSATEQFERRWGR